MFTYFKFVFANYRNVIRIKGITRTELGARIKYNKIVNKLFMVVSLLSVLIDIIKLA